jgi:hypothetical protein
MSATIAVFAGDPVNRRNNQRLGPDKRRKPGEHLADAVCLQCDKDDVLLEEIDHFVACFHRHCKPPAVGSQFEPARTNRRQVRATRNQADLMPRTREIRSKQPSDGSGSNDANLHNAQFSHQHSGARALSVC